MSQFKVIIVGGGPTGLTAGHCLGKAGIDFEILEARADLDFPGGTTIAIWSQNVRVLDQLGLMDEAYSMCAPIMDKLNILPDGSELARNNLPSLTGILFGHEWINVSRPELISLLRRRLPGGEARIYKNKRVVSVERHKEGISVRCADGSLHHGSMVIGSDGVHSVLRDIVTKEVPAGAKTAKNSKTEMTATFGALFGSADRQPSSSGVTDVPEGTFFETHGKDAMMQSAVMNGLVYFAIYGRLAEPAQERRRFSDADKMHFMSRWADSHFAPGVKVKDLVARAKWTNMVHLEEGVMDVPWYGDRVVLVGDSVHKMTPNLGLAYNQAMQGAVTLTNVLRRLLLESPAPSTQELRDHVFAPYQAGNMKNAIKANDISGISLRMGSWCNPLATWLDKYLMPRINGDETAIKLLVAPLILDGVVLDFVAEKAFKTGKKKWKHPGITGK